MSQHQSFKRGTKYLLWDGDCGFCARGAELGARLNAGGFALVPYQAFSDSELRRVGLSRHQCTRELQAITASGRAFGGAFAVNYFLWFHPFWRLLIALLYAFPIFVLAEVLTYQAISKNRTTISKVLGLTSCFIKYSPHKEN